MQYYVCMWSNEIYESTNIYPNFTFKHTSTSNTSYSRVCDVQKYSLLDGQGKTNYTEKEYNFRESKDDRAFA